jgi:hypothetical protein
MSGRIVAEILDYAPADLTPCQLVVLLALGEAAPERDRIARHNSSVADLARRARRPAGSVRNALAELARRGLIRPIHKGTHKGGRHQEYEIARLGNGHRLATMSGDRDDARARSNGVPLRVVK